MPKRRRLSALAWLPGLAVVLAAQASRASSSTAVACIDASEHAITLRKADHLREARTELARCASDTCPGEVRAECAKQLEAVNAAIPTVVFVAKDGSGGDLAAVSVTVDGAPVATRLDGAALELDPGEHAFTFAVEGQPPVTRTLVLHQGEKGRTESVVLGPPPAPPPPPTPIPEPTPAPAPARIPPPPRPPFWTTSRLTSAAVAGGGVVGVVVGSVLGLVALSKSQSQKSECPSACAAGPNAVAQSDHDAASTLAEGSNIAFALGGTAIATGVALWFALPAPKEGAPAVDVAPGPSGATLSFHTAF